MSGYRGWAAKQEGVEGNKSMTSDRDSFNVSWGTSDRDSFNVSWEKL